MFVVVKQCQIEMQNAAALCRTSHHQGSEAWRGYRPAP